MKTLKILALTALVTIGLSSCSNDDDRDETPQPQQVESKQVTNLHAPQGGGQGQPTSGTFTKFDFSSGTVTTSDTEWDIAFRGTTIIVNGGTSQGTMDEPARTGNAAGYIATNSFSGVTSVDTSLLVQDTQSTLAITGWYDYSGMANPNPGQNHLITPKAGRTLVFRTRDGKFAKVKLISYYKDAPSNPDSTVDTPRYYTFDYVYQPNDGVTNF